MIGQNDFVNRSDSLTAGPGRDIQRTAMLINTAIPRESQDTVERELEPGEQIQWIDMPHPAFFTVGSTVLFAFGIAWTAFALFWTTSAFHDNPGLGRSNVFFAALGLPFILVGLALLLTPILAYWGDLRTVYAITDRRAIVFRLHLNRTA